MQMKRIFLSCIIVISVIMLYGASIGTELTEAATTSFERVNTITVGNEAYSTVWVRDEMYEKQKIEYSVYNFVVTKNGKETIIEQEVLDCFITDKKVIYYTKIGNSKNTIYKYNLKSGKKKKILLAKKVGVFGCSGRYLYYGKYNMGYNRSGMYANMHTCRLKDKKKIHMVNNIGSVKYHKKYVLLEGGASDVSNTPIYLFKENGKKVKKLTRALNSRFKGKKIYCTICKYDNDYQMYYKVISFSLNGKNKKTVVKWTKDYSKIQQYQ